MSDSTMVRYFMFSRTHYDKIKDIETKAGNIGYVSGKVIVNGEKKNFTSIVRDPEFYVSLYGDAKIICMGDIRKIRYTEPS